MNGSRGDFSPGWIILSKTDMDTLSSLPSSILDGETRIMEVLLRLRRGESEDCQADIDALVAATASKKVILSYKESESSPVTKYMCLNAQTIRRLRTLFIHKGEEFTADYMADIFLTDVYQLEIEYIAADSGIISKNGTARAMGVASGAIVPTRSRYRRAKKSAARKAVSKRPRARGMASAPEIQAPTSSVDAKGNSSSSQEAESS